MTSKTTQTPLRKKCIIYARVSSAKQTIDGSGLSSQERTCRDFAERNSYEVVEVFTDVMSGGAAERPGMNALLAYLRHVNTKEFVVVVDDIARFARDVSIHTALRDKIISSGAKIESPSQKFDEDAGSRFIETVMAAIAEHERLKNAEQSRRRSIARMQNGYWVLRAPFGYRYEKDPRGGKRLVKAEPVASIVKEALEGFASGRFQSQSEVKRFLEAKPEFPNNYNKRNEVNWDTVKAILTNILYAGYIKYPKWDIPLTKAQHEPLITYATHELIQVHLDERSVAPARKGISNDFPLRGFLICEACGHALTACWARSHTGKRYPYYLCQYRGCSEKGKSSPRDKVEKQFCDYLKRLVPTQTTFELAKGLFRRAWEARNSSAVSETKRLRTKARQIERDVNKLVQSLVRSESARARVAYEKRIEELEQEKALIEDEVAKTSNPRHPFEKMFELSMRFLANPYEIWENGDLATKRTVLRLVFAKPLSFNRKKGIQTGETTFPFKALRFLEGTDVSLVPLKGLEPPTPSLRMTCSTS